MRINIYSQELTSEVKLIKKESNTGVVYQAVQLVLHSSPMLHHPPEDDDKEMRRVDEFGSVDWYYYPTVHAPLGPVTLGSYPSKQAALAAGEAYVQRKRAACP